MNSSLEKSRAREVVLSGNLLQLLKQRVGVRYLLTEDEFSGEHLSAYIFGSSLIGGRFFWAEVRASIGNGGVSSAERVDFEVWDDPDQLVAKFAHWESMETSHPWWNEFVRDSLFVGSLAGGIPLRNMGEIAASSQRLSLFHGLLVARVQAHLRDLEEMVGKEPKFLRLRADLFKQLDRRFRGFVCEAYNRQFAEKA